MTGIMIGFTRAAHRLGTVYGNGTLTAADTGIYAAGPNGGGSGDSTINLPATPSTDQTITVENTGTGTVTVDGNGNNIGVAATTTVAPGTMKWFVWGGYTWGFVTGSTCATVTLPDTHDFGTTTQGPAETPYDVPANTVTYSNIGYTPCGGLLRKIITTTYAGRSASNAFKVSGAGYDGVNHDGYGTTVNLAADAWFGQLTYGADSCPGSLVVSPPNGVWLQSISSISDFVYCDAWLALNGVCPGSSTGPVAAGTITSGLTIYYLDTHIIWTYEIV